MTTMRDPEFIYQNEVEFLDEVKARANRALALLCDVVYSSRPFPETFKPDLRRASVRTVICTATTGTGHAIAIPFTLPLLDLPTTGRVPS
jgi:hypothetical protein